MLLNSASQIWFKRFGILGLGLLGIAGLVFLQAAPMVPLVEAEKLYQQGKTPQARLKLAEILQNKEAPVKALLLMAEILLQEGDLEQAELQINPAIQRLQQAIHNGQNTEVPTLAWAFYLKGLIRLAPAIRVSETEEPDWEALKYWVKTAKESLQQAFALDASETRFRSGHEVVEAVERQDKSGLSGDRQGLVRLRRFVQQEPLYLRLAPRLPDASTSPEAIPESQEPVRASLRKWQEIKRNAFLNQEIEGLKEVLTGDALTETISAVQWWKNNPDAVYYGLELKSLKFLKIHYADAEHCQALAEVEEMRHNSEEGQVNSQYRVRYGLNRVGDIWYISEIQVVEQNATPVP